ncbi:hypothetical protein SCLCIDRAFT_843088 [Scleroderma citrinum Foug A]|uniref:Uncharacterized protein n=1 Tax=Scleroderma citrinum Foug A TaxID=1036808 RepID=A0A0C3E1S7_9AGAM|nr:hypothetical protein SCLCIDRAFT_843088 [Scleroderma citrinum Foug A]
MTRIGQFTTNVIGRSFQRLQLSMILLPRVSIYSQKMLKLRTKLTLMANDFGDLFSQHDHGRPFANNLNAWGRGVARHR